MIEPPENLPVEAQAAQGVTLVEAASIAAQGVEAQDVEAMGESADPLNDGAAKPPSRPLRTIPSTDLLQGDREVVILHQGEHYRLRLTRNDRLVLYK